MAGPVDLRSVSRLPIMVAPMGGGPSTPALVAAAAEAGAFGFLAAGYKTPDAMTAEIESVRALCDDPFGINVFVPGAPTEDKAGLDRYIAALGPSAAEPSWDDDHWDAKVEALLRHSPALVSFTFGCPSAEVIAAFRAQGTMVAVTVTASDEARIAAAAGADCLCVQGPEAGAHRGTFTNSARDRPGSESDLLELLAQVKALTDLPLIAAGGIATPEAVAFALAAGAQAVQAGTAFLRCPESGAHPVYKAALADPAFTTTAVTRAFSGRPARGLFNRFMAEHPAAPAAYPEINNATRPLRAAAATAGDAGRMSLWAGVGWRSAADLPAGEVVGLLAAGIRIC